MKINRIYNLVAIAILVLVLSGCAFNFMFYYPDKNPVPASEKGEDVYVSYTENKKVHGIFYPQKDPIASVFILHGNAGNLAGWKSVAESMHDEGYQTFIFDYPAFGNSDGRAKHKQVIPAAQAAFDYFNSLSEVRGTKKLIFGFSLGANLALKIGPDNQDELDGMIVEGVFNNYERIGMDRTPKMFRWFTWLALSTKFKGEETIKSWTKPLLIVHSKEDKVCPYWMAEQVYENAGSENKELWTIDGPHIRGFAQYGDLYFSKIRKLVE